MAGATNFDNSPPTVDTYADFSDSTPLGPTNMSTRFNDHSAAINAIESKILNGGIYVPTAYGNGLTTFTATWSGWFLDYGSVGFLSITGAVTSIWAGTGFLELALPSGWTSTGLESSFQAWCAPNPNPYGTHYKMTAVVHAGATRLRFIGDSGFTTTIDSVAGGPGFCVATITTNLITVGSGATHGLNIGDKVMVKQIDAAGLPTGLAAGSYFVIASGFTTTACKLSTTAGGSTVTIGSTKNCFVEKESTVTIAAQNQFSLAVDGVNTPFAYTGGTAWNSGTNYVVGNYASVSGVWYVCILNHTNHTPPNATYWTATGNADERDEFHFSGVVFKDPS